MLQSHRVDGVGIGANEDDAGLLDAAGELSILTQKAVARNDGIDGMLLANVENDIATLAVLAVYLSFTHVSSILPSLYSSQHIHVGIGSRAFIFEKHAGVGQSHMQGIGIGGGEYRDAGDGQLPTSTDTAHRDLAAVSDEDLFKMLRHCFLFNQAPLGRREERARFRSPSDERATYIYDLSDLYLRLFRDQRSCLVVKLRLMLGLLTLTQS